MGTNLLFFKRFPGSQAAQWLSIQCNQCYKHCLCYTLVHCQDPTQINLTQPEKSLRNKREGEGARRNPQIPRNTMLNPPTWSAKQKPAQTKYKPRLHSQNNQTAEGQIIWNVHIAAGRTCLQPACGGEEERCLPAWAHLGSSETLVLLGITGVTSQEGAHSLHRCWLVAAIPDASLVLFLSAHTGMPLQFVGWVTGIMERHLWRLQQAYTWGGRAKALKNFKGFFSSHSMSDPF